VDEVDHDDDAPAKKARRALTASDKEARPKKAARSRAGTIQVNRPSSPPSLPLLPPLAPSPVQTYENSLLPTGQLARPSRSTHAEFEDTATAQEDYNGLGSAYRLAASGFEPAYELAPQGAARGVGNESSTYGPNITSAFAATLTDFLTFSNRSPLLPFTNILKDRQSAVDPAILNQSSSHPYYGNITTVAVRLTDDANPGD